MRFSIKPLALCLDTGIASQNQPSLLYNLDWICSINAPCLITLSWVASRSVTIWQMLPVTDIVRVRASLKSAAEVPCMISTQVALEKEQIVHKSHILRSLSLARVAVVLCSLMNSGPIKSRCTEKYGLTNTSCE